MQILYSQILMKKTGALDINQVEKILKRKKTKKVKAVVNMHIGGIPNDVEKIL